VSAKPAPVKSAALSHNRKKKGMKSKKQTPRKPSSVFLAISKRLKVKGTGISRSTFGYND